MKKALILLIVVLFTISGCGSSTKQNAAREDSVASAPAEAQYSMAYGTVKDAEGNGSAEVQLQDRKIIQNAEVRLRVEDIEGVCEKIKNKTIELKGYLNDYSVHTNENNANADISLKVPGSNYQALLDFIVEQGKADFKREYTNDVTTQYIDLDARVKVLRAEEESLIKLLDRAEKIEDILKIKAQVTSTRQERESLEGQFKALSNSIEYATINISLYKPRNSDANVNVENLNIFSRSLSALIFGFNALTAKVGNVIVFFFTALPTIILIALMIFAFIYIRKIRRRKGNDV
ncbi:MAG: DUF4349 domain-containing protein [Dehalobacterium sp.]